MLNLTDKIRVKAMGILGQNSGALDRRWEEFKNRPDKESGGVEINKILSHPNLSETVKNEFVGAPETVVLASIKWPILLTNNVFSAKQLERLVNWCLAGLGEIEKELLLVDILEHANLSLGNRRGIARSKTLNNVIRTELIRKELAGKNPDWKVVGHCIKGPVDTDWYERETGPWEEALNLPKHDTDSDSYGHYVNRPFLDNLVARQIKKTDGEWKDHFCVGTSTLLKS